jgi:signal transduction histidine kinase
MLAVVSESNLLSKIFTTRMSRAKDSGSHNIRRTMFDRLRKLISALVMLVGCAVLAGWAFGIAPLRSIVPGLPEMVPNTALLFVLAGVALLSSGEHRARGNVVVRASAFVIVLIGMLTLAEYLFSLDLRIDGLLLHRSELVNKQLMFPGRMSPHTAFNFLLTGCALLLADVEMRRGIRPSELLALLIASVSLVALIGYVYGVSALYGISPQTGMALHTAATFILLSAGLMLLEPARGLMRVVTGKGLGGIVARKLLAAAVIVPLALGWLSVLGQRAGFYDVAMQSSLLVVGSILVFSTLIWSGAKTLDRVDVERQQAESARAHLLQRFVGAQEEERRRLARELHDQMGQHLAALKLQLELHESEIAKSTSGTSAPHTSKHLASALELADTLSGEVGTLAWELRPPELDDLGLVAALTRYVEKWSKRSGVAVDFVTTGLGEGQPRLPPETEVTLYRVIQEALTNVLKHARAGGVSIVMERTRDEILAVIEDDGCGFDAEASSLSPAAAKRLGVLGMRERIESARGTFKPESGNGAGTTIVARIPVGHAHEGDARNS